MAEEQRPLVRVLKFHQTFERVAIKGDPLIDDVDNRGFKLGENGKRILENTEVDWVTYAPAHAPLTAATTERIRHLRPTEEMMQGEPSEKLKFMMARWAAIEPAYTAWKHGHEMPISGTPLGMWAGISSAMADVLKQYQIRTVEEVRDLSESQLEKIKLPNMRELRKMAKAFLDNYAAATAAEREVERDNEMSMLRERMQDQQEKLDAAMALLEAKQGTDEIDDLRARLDAKGVKYHHKAGVETLRALLLEDAA